MEFLSKLDRIEVVKRLMRRNKDLEDEVHALRKALFLHTGRPYPASGTSGDATRPRSWTGTRRPLTVPGAGFDVDGLPASGHPGDYVPHSFGSPFLATANPYDQWPSSVVPVPSTATVHSVESSPGASGPGEDFTPAYVHTSVPMMDGPVMTSSTSAPSSIASAKVDYQELDAGTTAVLHAQPITPGFPRLLTRRFPPGPSPTSGYSNHSGQASSSTYLQEQQPWPIYQPGTYYSHATAL